VLRPSSVRPGARVGPGEYTIVLTYYADGAYVCEAERARAPIKIGLGLPGPKWKCPGGKPLTLGADSPLSPAWQPSGIRGLPYFFHASG